MMWIMTSEEFITESHQNKKGKNKGKRTTWFNGRQTDRKPQDVTEHCKPQFLQYVATDFSRFAAS